MTTFVIDASVAAKWWFPENLSANAAILLRSNADLFAPDQLPVELANVVVQKFRRGQVSDSTASRVLRSMARMSVTIGDSRPLLAEAYDLAIGYHPSIYDCIYAALAISMGVQVVTADREFYDNLRKPYPDAMLWVADIPA